MEETASRARRIEARRDIDRLGTIGPMLRIGQIARGAVEAARRIPGVRAAALHLRDTVTGTVRLVTAEPAEAETPPPPEEADRPVAVDGPAGPGAAVGIGGFAEFGAILTVSLDRPLDPATTAALEEAARGAAEAVSTAVQFDYFFQRARSNYLLAEATKALIEDFPRQEAAGDRLGRLLAKAAELVGPFLEIDGLVLAVEPTEAVPGATYAVGRDASDAHRPEVRQAAAGEVVRGEAGGEGPLIALPMRVGDRVVGAAAAWRATPLAAHELLTFHTIVSEVGIAASNAQLLDELERLAITDGLTRLLNHRHFQDRLKNEVARAKRYNQPLALLMMDIDDFKRVNDAYGHPVGDRLLEETARILAKCLRETDVLARYGGEEFAAILPSTDSEGVTAVANRILEAIRRYAFAVGETVVPVRISIGTACLPDDGMEPAALIDRADKALYEAKRGGKDRHAAASTRL